MLSCTVSNASRSQVLPEAGLAVVRSPSEDSAEARVLHTALQPDDPPSYLKLAHGTAGQVNDAPGEARGRHLRRPGESEAVLRELGPVRCHLRRVRFADLASLCRVLANVPETWIGRVVQADPGSLLDWGTHSDWTLADRHVSFSDADVRFAVGKQRCASLPALAQRPPADPEPGASCEQVRPVASPRGALLDSTGWTFAAEVKRMSSGTPRRVSSRGRIAATRRIAAMRP